MVILEGSHEPFYKPNAVKAVIELIAPPKTHYTCFRDQTGPNSDILVLTAFDRKRSAMLEIIDGIIHIGLIEGKVVRAADYEVAEIYQAAQRIIAWLDGN